MAKRWCAQLTAPAGPARSSAAGQESVRARGYVRQQLWQHLRTFWSQPSSTEAAASLQCCCPDRWWSHGKMFKRQRHNEPTPYSIPGSLEKGGMVLTDAQHSARVEELRPWPFIYPLLHNQDVPGTQEKFLSQGQKNASCTRHVLLHGTYPNEGWERQPTAPDTFPHSSDSSTNKMHLHCRENPLTAV